jgi:hypothetical protein
VPPEARLPLGLNGYGNRKLSALFPKFGLGCSGEEKTLLDKPAVAPWHHASLKGRCECATVFGQLSTKYNRLLEIEGFLLQIGVGRGQSGDWHAGTGA